MRYLVAFVSVVAGIFGAAAEFRWGKPAHLISGSNDEMAFIYGLCVTFYGTAYATGRVVYVLLGRDSLLQELRHASARHLLLLHALAMLIAVYPSLTGLVHLPLLSPAILVACGLFLWSLYEWWTS